MIPLSDIDRRPLRIPYMTALITGANVTEFLLGLMQGEPFVLRWSVIPSQIDSFSYNTTKTNEPEDVQPWDHLKGQTAGVS